MLVQFQPDRPIDETAEARTPETRSLCPLRIRLTCLLISRSQRLWFLTFATPLFSQPRSSIVRASAFEAEGWWRESTRGRQFPRPCGPTAETPASEAAPVRVQRQNATADRHEVRSRLGTAAGAATPAMGAISCSGYGTLQFPERQVYCLAGFSDKTLDTLKQLDADPGALIRQIEAVPL